MRSAVRWFVVVLLVLHGLIHLLGAAKGLGWAAVSALTQPIGAGAGLVWLGATGLVLLAAGLFAGRVSWWWLVGVTAAAVSQVAICTSWTDAWAGSLANVALLLASGHGYLSLGPGSLRARYRRQAAEALASAPSADQVVTAADLEQLPSSIAGYLRRTGAVGRPRVYSFRARIHGRIRSGPGQPWMSFVGEQVNTFGPAPTRTFFLDATRIGMAIDVLHRFAGGQASMQVKALSLIPIVDASGPELDRAETVTVFNDLCLLAPAALIDTPIQWEEIDDRRTRGWFTVGGCTVAADLTFNQDHDLVDFVSDDRLRSSSNGRSFIPQRWSTPIREWRESGLRRVTALGEAHWHAPDPDGEFSYLEFHLDGITYNTEPGITAVTGRSARPRHAPGPFNGDCEAVS